MHKSTGLSNPRHRGQPTVHLHRHEISHVEAPRGAVDAHVGLAHVDAAHAVHGQHRGGGVRKGLHAIHIEVLREKTGGRLLENLRESWHELVVVNELHPWH